MLALALLVAQSIALVVLLARLSRGRTRRAPLAPAPAEAGAVSVIVATLNEAHRIGPCLEGLHRQGPELAEVLVVDSRSEDGTRDIVAAMAARDPRVRLVDDGPLPPGWVGKVWALECGLRESRAPWVLGIDADTVPHDGLVGGVVAAAGQDGYDVLSLAPRFDGQGAAERWLQPALLTTIVYRFGPAGDREPDADRVMANGQCFLARRDVLERHGGYAPARVVVLRRRDAGAPPRASWRARRLPGRLTADRRAAPTHRRARCGANGDARSISRTRARHGGRRPTCSSSRWRRALPCRCCSPSRSAPVVRLPLVVGGALLAVNAAFVVVRLLVNVALRHSYARTGVSFWLSPLADPLAALRILLSSVRRPRRWRGREYGGNVGSAPAVQAGQR